MNEISVNISTISGEMNLGLTLKSFGMMRGILENVTREKRGSLNKKIFLLNPFDVDLKILQPTDGHSNIGVKLGTIEMIISYRDLATAVSVFSSFGPLLEALSAASAGKTLNFLSLAPSFGLRGSLHLIHFHFCLRSYSPGTEAPVTVQESLTAIEVKDKGKEKEGRGKGKDKGKQKERKHPDDYVVPLDGDEGKGKEKEKAVVPRGAAKPAPVKDSMYLSLSFPLSLFLRILTNFQRFRSSARKLRKFGFPSTASP
jgi:hypothetical protein